MEFIFQFLNIHRISFVYENDDDVIGFKKYKIYFNLARKWIKKQVSMKEEKIIF